MAKDVEKSTLLNEELEKEYHHEVFSRKSRSCWNTVALILLLAASLAGNMATLMKVLPAKSCLSSYAKLERNVSVAWTDAAVTTNESDPSPWDTLYPGDGVVALGKDSILKYNLPYSAEFPWDPTKHIYLVNSFHNLHCLKIMRSRFFGWERGESIDHDTLWHVMHCIDSLRQDIICHADDTPRYGGLEGGKTGEGQVHTCKDFSQLENWVKENTACHRHDPDITTLERYTFCPKGTSYMENMHKVFPNAMEVDI